MSFTVNRFVPRIFPRIFPMCGATLVTLLSACSAPEPYAGLQAGQPLAAEAARRPVPQPAQLVVPALTIDAYKKEFARHVAQSSPSVFRDPLPRMFKSIVVLDVTIDPSGRLASVKVHRSNGYKQLENTALLSVRHAGPFTAPSRAIRGRDGSVNFLETFLFRDDGRFQIRSLVEDT